MRPGAAAMAGCLRLSAARPRLAAKRHARPARKQAARAEALG